MTRTFQAQSIIRGSYLLKAETLLRIIEHMTSSGGTLKAALTFKNGRTIESEDINEILSDSLVTSTKIGQLKLKTIQSPNGTAEVHFTDYSAAMIYSIQGERQWVLTLEQDILNEFNSGKLWSSNLNPNRWPVNNWNTAVLWICLVMGILFLVMSYLGQWLLEKMSIWSLSFLIGFPIIGLLQTYLFPSLHFGFGKGLESYKTKSNILHLVIVLVGLGLILSVAGNYISKKVGI